MDRELPPAKSMTGRAAASMRQGIGAATSGRIKEALRRPFVRNLSMVAAGTAGAQAIALIFSPILTRLYGPEIYGLAGMFVAMVSAASPIAALTYPVAIVLPEREADARGLALLSVIVAATIATALGLVLLVGGDKLAAALNIEPIASFLFLIPVAIFSSGLLQIAEQQLIRAKAFRITASSAVVFALCVNVVRVIGGLVYPAASVLIGIATAGIFGNALMLGVRTYLQPRRAAAAGEPRKSLISLAREHIDFPIFRAPQSLIAAVSQSLPALVLGATAGPAAAGFYALARASVYLPVGLLGQSLQKVLYPGLNEERIGKRPVTPLIETSSRYLALLGIPLFSVIVIFGPGLFEFAFGTGWARAGEYSQWLSIWLFFLLVNRPAMSAVPVLRLQGWFLRLELVSFALRAASLFAGFMLFHDDSMAVALFSLTSAAVEAYLLVFVLHKARTADEAQNNA